MICFGFGRRSTVDRPYPDMMAMPGGIRTHVRNDDF